MSGPKAAVWVGAAALLAGASVAFAQTTERVSVSSLGVEGDKLCDFLYFTAMSRDGGFVGFTSLADNMVPDDTNNKTDVFIRDRAAGLTERVSVTSAGVEVTDYPSLYPTVSKDGRHVAFISNSKQFYGADDKNLADIFVRDRVGGTTECVSVTPTGEVGNDNSWMPAISDDGRFVAFFSWASNLVADDTNGVGDVFVFDRQTHAAERVSIGTDGRQGFLTDPDMEISNPAISADGRFVAFPCDSPLSDGDTNDQRDVYVRDRLLGTTTLVSVATDGTLGNGKTAFPAISADGRIVVFRSFSDNLVPSDHNGVRDVFAHDMKTGKTWMVSVTSAGAYETGGSGASYPAISANGRIVAFRSSSTDLVESDGNGWIDVFVHDNQTGKTTRVSVSQVGAEADGQSLSPGTTGDGRYVSFYSEAKNLVPDDLNGAGDIFVRDRGADCRADYNGDGKLNVNDFIAFQASFVRQDPWADFNGDGKWNINDFIAFQAAYRKGCA